MRKPLYEQIINHFGGIGGLAGALTDTAGEKGISYQAVHLWKGVIPPNRAFEIQVLSNGKFNADQIIKEFRKARNS